ncbi:sugar phosphate isomerase/epimerase family protein [Paenibacillus chartarius]|uniref:Sugar phosphate isomerase/epimerase family protein n=1 Tax=Paenibacillus chartarius TaxID=747481 RepID=A0ABV6DTX1_9BACL
MAKMGIALQLYTLRNETATDFAGTLRRVAEIGYEGVEFAGYGGLAPQELKALLAELNLKAVGSHVSLARLKDNLDEEIEMNLAIGNKYVICPYLVEADRQEPGLHATLEVFKEAAEKLAQHGIQFGYHNHAFELEEKVGDKLLFDHIFAELPADKAVVEMDVCWVTVGGQDPVAYIGKYAGRLPLLHLKDIRKDDEGKIQTVELGQGDVDLPAVIEAAGNAGTEWLVVEQDHCQNPPIESVTNSMGWLKQNYL